MRPTPKVILTPSLYVFIVSHTKWLPSTTAKGAVTGYSGVPEPFEGWGGESHKRDILAGRGESHKRGISPCFVITFYLFITTIKTSKFGALLPLGKKFLFLFFYFSFIQMYMYVYESYFLSVGAPSAPTHPLSAPLRLFIMAAIPLQMAKMQPLCHPPPHVRICFTHNNLSPFMKMLTQKFFWQLFMV